MHRHFCSSPPLARGTRDGTKPQRQALVSMNSGRLVGEVHPAPVRMQELVVFGMLYSRIVWFDGWAEIGLNDEDGRNETAIFVLPTAHAR